MHHQICLPTLNQFYFPRKKMADDEDYEDYEEVSDAEKLAIVKYFVTHTPPGHTKTIIEGQRSSLLH